MSNHSKDILTTTLDILKQGGTPDLLEMEVLRIKETIKAQTMKEAIDLTESFLNMKQGELDYLRNKYKENND